MVLFRRAAEMISAPTAGVRRRRHADPAQCRRGRRDGRLAAAEQDVLEQRVIAGARAWPKTSAAACARTSCVPAEPPTPASLRKHASLLPESQRQDAGDLLAAWHSSDGSIDRAEIDPGHRYFDALGLEPAELQPGARARRRSAHAHADGRSPVPGLRHPRAAAAGEPAAVPALSPWIRS